VPCVLQVAKTLPEQISQYAQVVLQTLAYAGTGDVLQIQSLLAMCGEHTEVDENAAWKVSIGPCLVRAGAAVQLSVAHLEATRPSSQSLRKSVICSACRPLWNGSAWC
jgi:hypothetical protein